MWNSLAYLVVVGAGVGVALQQILNARLRAELESPWWAGTASYAVGLIVMLAAIVVFGAPRLSAATLARTSLLSWAGGLFGAIFIATGIFMVPRFGAATVLALIVIGQTVGSLVFDHFGFFGLSPHAASPVRLAGAALLVLGAVLIRA